MALQTTLATRYWLKTIVMSIVCLVLGFWGLYDLLYTIPWKESAATKHIFLVEEIQPAIESEFGSAVRNEALVKINELQPSVQDGPWATSLSLYAEAIGGGGPEIQTQAEETLQADSRLYEVTKPSKFDWYMQWVFVACIPFGFYYLYMYFKMKKRAAMYCLDDAGDLQTPEGAWKSNDIVDIDMSRWIAKTGNARSTWTAKAVVEGGGSVLLDDYIYKDMHLIIGSLAHRFYPDEWTPLAKRVKHEDEDVDAPEEE